MWEENVQVQLIFITNGLVVVGMHVAGVNVNGHHLLPTVYKGFLTANGFSIVNLVIMKLSNQVEQALKCIQLIAIHLIYLEVVTLETAKILNSNQEQ